MIDVTPAFVSAVVASVSVVVAISAFVINRRSYRIAANQDKLRRPDLILYLQHVQVHHFPNESARYFDCALRVTNNSDTANSIAQVRLSLTRTRTRVPTTLEVEATQALPNGSDLPKTAFQIPRHLAPREVVEGRVIFKVPDQMLDGRRRQRYVLGVIDAHSMVHSTRIILVNEHEHDNEGRDSDSTRS